MNVDACGNCASGLCGGELVCGVLRKGIARGSAGGLLILKRQPNTSSISEAAMDERSAREERIATKRIIVGCGQSTV